jgi:hypothetical protein
MIKIPPPPLSKDLVDVIKELENIRSAVDRPKTSLSQIVDILNSIDFFVFRQIILCLTGL